MCANPHYLQLTKETPMKHALLIGALVACLLPAVLPASAGASHRAPLTASLSGTASPAANGAADLTITNDGANPVIFDRGVAPKPLDQAAQAGADCQTTGNQWHCGPFSVPAHGTFHILLHGPQGLTAADGPFQLFATEDGKHDDGPFMIPWAVEQPKPCQCAKLHAVASGVASGQLTHPNGPVHVGMTITWDMTCTAGKGHCKGKIKVLPPAGSDVKITQPTKTVTCSVPCESSNSGSFRLKATSADDLDFDNRAGKSYAFRLRLSCAGGSSVEKITLAFGRRGFLDRKKSDLNGNGIPDGKEK